MVLPYINMNPPQVYTYSPSWTLLPPPSAYHPSGSSQCTSPKHPVSCIKPGLTCIISLSLFIFMHWRRKWQPTPVLLPGESQGLGGLLSMGSHWVRDDWSWFLLVFLCFDIRSKNITAETNINKLVSYILFYGISSSVKVFCRFWVNFCDSCEIGVQFRCSACVFPVLYHRLLSHFPLVFSWQAC